MSVPSLDYSSDRTTVLHNSCNVSFENIKIKYSYNVLEQAHWWLNMTDIRVLHILSEQIEALKNVPDPPLNSDLDLYDRHIKKVFNYIYIFFIKFHFIKSHCVFVCLVFVLFWIIISTDTVISVTVGEDFRQRRTISLPKKLAGYFPHMKNYSF